MNEDDEINTEGFSDSESLYNEDHIDCESNDLINELNTEKFKIINNYEKYLKYIIDKKTTRPYITKFEKTKIIGLRATQIENGDTPLVKVPEGIISSVKMAELELENRLIPLIVRRQLTDGKFEDWKINDFVNIND